jgi:malate dehydrogenase (oxaloacetate-decarboxylating)
MTRDQGSAIETELFGKDLLSNPTLNKDTAFTNKERDRFKLHGLLPAVVESLEQQIVRAYEGFKRKSDDLERHIFLRALQDRNETLFYALLNRHIAEMAPIIYTPVVAQGCINFSHIYRRPRGLFLSYPLADKMDEIIENRPYREVDVIVATDGERVLGIGDQGAGGMGIPIGKLSLYTLIGGIEPQRTLPIVLDVGTNNSDRLHDPEYVGWRHERITGQDYWNFVDRFVRCIMRKLPNVLLQWEDFAKPHARPILEKYRDSLCTFNDDIQGTAAVALGALYKALRITKKQFSDQTVVILGAGSAGTGIAEYILKAMVTEGMQEADARKHFYLLDSKGLLHTDRTNLTPVQQKFAQPFELVSGWRGNNVRIGLAEVIKNSSATILMGVSSQPGQFTEPIIKEMASKVERPVVFPLSNPYYRAEAVPEDIIHWTDGRALVATGTEFPPVSLGGKTFKISQCNNFYIFPAIGLSVISSESKRVTDGMMVAAAEALGNFSEPENNDDYLLPSIESMKEVAIQVAVAVGLQAQQDRVARTISEKELRERVQERFWSPRYVEYKSMRTDNSNGD